MRKYLINTIVLLMISVNLFAKGVNEKEVSKFASNWLSENESFLHYGNYKYSNEKFNIHSIKAIINNSNDIQIYVVELNPLGFILISADNRLKPIIGYSSENNFNFQNVEKNIILKSIITDLNNNLLRISNESNTQTNSDWKIKSTDKGPYSFIQNTNAIYGPFLESDWGQGYVSGNPVYNYYSPNRWPTGCVATATAQILNFYKWPYQGVGSHSYSDDGQYLSADFGETFYDWENTLDLYENVSFNLENQKAAGLISYHTAVALEMDFESNGSTANTTDVPDVLHNYFRASGHYQSESTTGFWDAMKSNMLDERPAIISIKASSNGAGHAAVVDGYFETNNYYHVNPGWYGDETGWYDISGDWYMGGYDIVIGATKGIVPSPQINEIERLTENSFLVSWKTSRNQKADYYELLEATSSLGPWTSLSNSITDTVYQISDAKLGSYYYKVRANRDSIWWDYSTVKKLQIGTDRGVTFQVDMTNRPIADGDTIVIRGNTPPLAGSVNSIGMVNIDSSNVYKLNLNFEYDYVGQTIIYRYFIQTINGLIAEGNNREHILTSEVSQIIPEVYFDDAVGMNDLRDDIPNNFRLEQNYPNPFNPTTTINYSIPIGVALNATTTSVSLKIYDVLGKEIAILVNKEQSVGNYSVKFNANNLTSGIYFYQISAGQFIETKKMSIIK